MIARIEWETNTITEASQGIIGKTHLYAYPAEEIAGWFSWEVWGEFNGSTFRLAYGTARTKEVAQRTAEFVAVAHEQ